jgi:hypothetical protein
MQKNMGLIDKILRILAAIIIVVLYATNIISGTLAIILLVVAGVFILTSFIGSCPLYLPLKKIQIKRKINYN